MKAPRHSRTCSLRRRFTALLTALYLVFLITTGGAVLILQSRQLHREFSARLLAVARAVAANAAAAVTSRDAAAAASLLHSLTTEETVLGGALILPDESVLATFGQAVTNALGPDLEDRFRHPATTRITTPVSVNGAPVATLAVLGDHHAIHSQLFPWVAWMLPLIALVGGSSALLFSLWLERNVAQPIQRLTATAEKVAHDQDYSARAHQEPRGELAVLTRTFNQMLACLQEQGAAVTQSQQKFEALVNSIDSVVWERTTPEGPFTFVSRQCQRILGFPPQQLLADPDFWPGRIHPDDARALRERPPTVTPETPYTREFRLQAGDGRLLWIRESASVFAKAGGGVTVRGIFLDISAQKRAAEELANLHRRLMDASRFAGMAEVATGVLHNVGNVLNSVSVSVTLLVDRLKESRLPRLQRATALLAEHPQDLARFLTEDPRGKVLPDYLIRATEQLAREHQQSLSEATELRQYVDHLKEIVAMQQSYAKISGAFEPLDAVELVEDALRLNAASFQRHHIEVHRDYAPNLPRVLVDRHKVLQILINLIRNAKHAVDIARNDGKRVELKVENPADGRITIRIRDNGVGIAPENLNRIFQHGFTTKRDGHGFGLHSGANAAREIGGRLTASSNGVGQGAEFTLDLPVAPPS